VSLNLDTKLRRLLGDVTEAGSAVFRQALDLIC